MGFAMNSPSTTNFVWAQRNPGVIAVTGGMSYTVEAASESAVIACGTSCTHVSNRWSKTRESWQEKERARSYTQGEEEGRGKRGGAVMDKFSKQINDFIEAKNYKEAREWINSGLKWTPWDHWLLDRMSVTYYDDGQYDEALKWSKKAYKYANDCPMVLWGYADTLDILGQKKLAVRVFLRLFKLAEKESRGIHGKCQWEEDERGFRADAAFRLALAYESMSKRKRARHWLLAFQSMREQNWPTVYSQESMTAAWRRIFSPQVANSNKTKNYRDLGGSVLEGRPADAVASLLYFLWCVDET